MVLFIVVLLIIAMEILAYEVEEFCWIFDILIANISWTVAQSSMNHIIF